MSVKNAYKLCLGLFKQDSTGTAYAKLPEPYDDVKWNLESIIPSTYDFTNFQMGDTTIETVETNTITQMSKSKKYDSGALTPPTYNFATILPGDAATIVAILDALKVDDPFKVLICAGAYKSESLGVRTYDVFNAACAILTTDGGRSGEAKQNFTGALGLQSNHLPIIGVTNCAATMTWDTSDNMIALVVS